MSMPAEAGVFAALLLSLLFFSCSGTTQPPANDSAASQPAVQQHTVHSSTDSVTITRTPVGSSGFTIELPSSHRIETHQGAGFTMVYYIISNDTVVHPGEAGMYFGPNPDIKPPSVQYSERMIDTVFLGKKQKWVEYTTEKYVQRETFIDEGNGQYIHAWCYSNRSAELERLFRMMLSLER